MKRTETHEIDKNAQNILESILPSSWITRNQNPDYGIDYNIELVKNENLTGIVAGVQLKGKKNIIIKDNTVKYSLKTKSLSYYVDDCRIPVFLIHVDTTHEKGYWIFLQRYAIDQLKEKNWRKQKSITINIPESNTLNDIQSFESAIIDSEKFMMSCRPGAILPAIEAEQFRMNSLDPRFRTDIDITNNKININLNAKTDVTIEVTVKGDDAVQRMQHSIDYGLPVEFSEDEIELIGSPLFDMEQHKIAGLHSKITHNPEVLLSAVDSKGNSKVEPVYFNGTLEGGRKELKYDGELPNSPISIQFKIVLNPEKLTVKDFTVSYNINKWRGQRLSKLAYFDQLFSLFNSFQEGAIPFIKCNILGNQLFCGEFKTDEMNLSPLATVLPVLNRARSLVEFVEIDPLFPIELKPYHLIEIDQLYDMINFGTHIRSGKGFKITLSITEEGFHQFIDKYEGEEIDGPLSGKADLTKIPFLEDNVEGVIKIIKMSLSKFRYSGALEELRELDKTKKLNVYQLPFEGADDSELKMEVLERIK